MIHAVLPFMTAIGLSTIAAYYSIIGLAQIFPGSYWPIVIMGTVLEIAKLVTVSWLYNNWKTTMIFMRYYFLISIILLMLITSMGIFGYLSKAHIETNVEVGANNVQLDTLKRQEQILNNRLDYLLKKAGDDPEKIARKTNAAIQETQENLVVLSNKMLPLLQTENQLLAEVGPIRYIAEFLYDKNDTEFIDKAVRTVIFAIIFVFDPLAILLLIASNKTYKEIKSKRPKKEIVKKVIKRKKLDKRGGRSLESFYVDDKHKLIAKNKITNMETE